MKITQAQLQKLMMLLSSVANSAPNTGLTEGSKETLRELQTEIINQQSDELIEVGEER